MITFFFDNDISWRIVDALKALVDPTEIELIALRERYPASAADTTWIPEAGKQGWIVVSRDQNQRRREAEHSALMLHRVRAIYIRQAGNPGDLYADAARIIRNWPKILAWGQTAAPRTLARLDTADRVNNLRS